MSLGDILVSVLFCQLCFKPGNFKETFQITSKKMHIITC